MVCDQSAYWLPDWPLFCRHAFPVMTSRIPSRTVCKAEWSLSSLTCFPPGYSIRTSEKKLIIVFNGERFKLRDTLLTRNFHLLFIVSNNYHPFSVPSCSGLEANSVNLKTNKKTLEQNGSYFKLMFYNNKVFNSLYISNSSLNSFHIAESYLSYIEPITREMTHNSACRLLKAGKVELEKQKLIYSRLTYVDK